VRLLVLLAALAGSTGFAGPARAQQNDAPPQATRPSAPPQPQAPIGAPADTSGRTSDVLAGRNRSRMHPGDPLVIVGEEQGDNDLRSKTPVLAQSDRAVSYVNQDENRRRTLAMYESGATFHDPLLARTVAKPYVGHPMAAQFSSDAASLAEAEDVLSHAGAPGASSGDKPRNRWPWVFGVTCSVLVGIYLLRRSGLGS
jgi:hypothetical protein